MTLNSTLPLELLLVEDNPGDARLTREALGRSGSRSHLIVVPSGDEALGYLRREKEHAEAVRPDVVLLDLNLPRVDGKDVLRALKGDERLRSIPVIVLSSSEAPEDVEDCYRLGASCYVTKPVDFDEYVATISRIAGFWGDVARLPRRARV